MRVRNLLVGILITTGIESMAITIVASKLGEAFYGRW
jgi:hypothetical protein